MSEIAGLFPGSSEEVLHRIKAMLPNHLARYISYNKERADNRESWDVPGEPLTRWCSALPIDAADDLRFSVPKSKAPRLIKILGLDEQRHIDWKEKTSTHAVIHFRSNDLLNKVGPALMRAYLTESLKETLRHNGHNV